MSETPQSDAGNAGADKAEAFDLADFMSDFEKQMAALRQRAQPARGLIDATSVRLVSDGGEVAVTVTISGKLVDVEFLPAAASVAPVDLAALVVDTYDRAATAARERTHDIVEGFVDHNAQARNLARRLMDQAAAERARRQSEES
ncbi:YbaB/EbfC family nucleoid-associated protein [Glycomyces tritici]|uniref:YbaB/EbfC family nucleoid-associated protein n=1 Tax=Glycomyces tritici TaxID=2665176 RepID=A0ABT7YV12_9ACTN|nr:YbaB/EbfC family nucleoid-associated protein [Glycomyces tritici]MDN3242103.1 YbaB/EbfC family nucleoid-associated protein [Glycomyces tritici]MDN3243673.1 YbaB/EbfC family nucleoid-associated protein [Glycomyces tritici]